MKQSVLFSLAEVRLHPGILKERQETDCCYLLELLDPERLLAPWYAQAHLPSPPPYGGWEARDIAGHSGGHYLSALAACYAATGSRRALERAQQFVSGIERCQRKHGDGYAGAVDKRCFEKLRHGEIHAGGFMLNDVWVPLYTLHKMMAGLRDADQLCRIAAAREIACKQTRYLMKVWESLDDDQMQEILKCEHGGIAETLIDLAETTGDRKILDFACRAFCQKSVLDPLRAGRDELDGMHGNTMIPKVIGLAKLYNATGDESARKAAEFFFDRVVNFRSFANGGNGESEHFFAIGTEKDHLTAFTTETCNSYNMIKLAELLFEWEPRACIMDFVERALLNHVAANIGRKPGEFGYFLSMAPVAVKVFSTPEDSFWCCVGTGMESPMRYARTFYARSGNTLWINHYFPSELIWREQDLKVTAAGGFPESGLATFQLQFNPGISSRKLALKLRRPCWASTMRIALNGAVISVSAGADGYFTIERLWHDGDRLEVSLPMEFRSEPLPGTDRRAFFRGPVLLAGVLPSAAGEADPARERFSDHLKARGKTDEFPPHLIADRPIRDPHEAEAAPAMKLDWRPLYQVYEEHYGVYFRVMDRRRYRACEEELRRLSEREKARRLAVVDEVFPGFQQSEVEHALRESRSDTGDFQRRKFRRALPGGEFSYEMGCDPDLPLELELLYWGAEWSGARIAILADGVMIAEQQTHTLCPGEWSPVHYPVPKELTAGKNLIRLTVRHLEGGDGGRVFHLSIIRKSSVQEENR